MAHSIDLRVHRRLALTLGLVVTLLIGGCSATNLHHRLHWLLYGHDKVWYHNRTYYQPRDQPCADLVQDYGPLHRTGEEIIGLPVLDTGISFGTVPTVLILQTATPGTCLTYALSGGP